MTSRPSDVKARQAIRVTWGEKKSWWGYEVLTFFLLGQQAEREDKTLALSLEDEHVLYGDIIRQDFLDTYNNLTLKTIMAFRWVMEFCPNAKVVLVGCKLDMRTDLATLRELSKQRRIPVTHEQVRPLYLQLNSNLDLTPISGFFGS